MNVYLVENKALIAPLFVGWNETMIWSCLQDYMGLAYADSETAPRSAQICVGDFCFFAGESNEALVRNWPANLNANSALFGPQTEAWSQVIEQVYQEKAVRHMRYATKKEPTSFDMVRLQALAASLPAPYAIAPIGRTEYMRIQQTVWAADWCANYPGYEEYERIGLGFVIQKDGEFVSGASSYTSYRGGIEIQIDTREDERGKGLASVCGAALILECLRRGLYPSWDAHDKRSLALAQKLGYSLDREYPVYLMEL